MGGGGESAVVQRGVLPSPKKKEEKGKEDEEEALSIQIRSFLFSRWICKRKDEEGSRQPMSREHRWQGWNI